MMAATDSLPLGPDTELARLASAFFAGSLTVADRDRLVVLLGDPHTRTAYRRIVWVHANLLRLWGQSVEGMVWAPQPVAEPAAAPVATDAGWLGERFPRSRMRGWPRRAAIVALMVTLGTALAAATTFVAIGVFQRPAIAIPTRPPRIAGAIAEIAALELPRWAASAKAWQLWDGLTPGSRVELAAGRIEIACDDGATIVLEGPAAFTVQRAKEAVLDRGKATVTVRGPSAGGPRFTLQTPSATLTDIGTSFGVIVGEAGETCVTVFDGLVDLLPRGSGASPLRLAAGEAGDTRLKKPARKVSPPAERFARSLQTPSPALAAALASLGWDAARATTIYRDPLTGASSLGGTKPASRGGIGEAEWLAPPAGWQCEPQAAALVATTHGAAHLPFRPEQGYLYRISATIQATTGGVGWAALGFTNETLATGYVPQGPWMLQRHTTSTQANACFAGPGQTHPAGRGDRRTGRQTRTILLDTSAPSWRAVFLVDGLVVGEHRYAAANPTITHVCITAFPNTRMEVRDLIVSSSPLSLDR